jgi:chemotaxis protein MotD
MMDIIVPGGAPGKETASVVKSGRQTGKGEESGGRGGFSDALTKAGAGGAGSDHDGVEPEPAGALDREGPAEATGKPLIDLSNASLKGQVNVRPESIGRADRIAAKPVKGQDEGKAGLAFGDLEPKEEPSDETLDAAENSVHAKDGRRVKGGDTIDARKQAESRDNADTGAGDDDVSDVLGLLKQDPADTPAAVVPMHVPVGEHAAPAKADRAAAPSRKADVDLLKTAASQASAGLGSVGSHGEDDRLPGTEAVEPEGRTFRISRADGRGRSMDMRIGADRNAPAEEPKKAGVENVSVLESRRYIGLAQNSNSAAVTAALSGDGEWARAMQPSAALSNAAEWTSTGKVVNTLQIQMNPVDLGLVTATMRLSGDTLNVDLKVETGTAYRQLKEDHDKILEALRSQGYAVDNVTISMAPVDRSDAGNQANSQGQASQQQSLSQQGQGGEARERHNQAAQRTDGVFNDAGGTGMEDASVGVAGGSRSGGVYL